MVCRLNSAKPVSNPVLKLRSLFKTFNFHLAIYIRKCRLLQNAAILPLSRHFWRSSNGKTSPHDVRMFGAPYYTKFWTAVWTSMQSWDPHTLTHANVLELPTSWSVSPHQRSVNPTTIHSSLAQCVTGTAFLFPPGWPSNGECTVGLPHKAPIMWIFDVFFCC